MRVNEWQRKRAAAKRWSVNAHAAKCRRRMERPAPDYPPDRMDGRFANVVINLPWLAGDNTVLLAVEFAPRPHRRDRVVFVGQVMSLTEFCRVELRRRFPKIGEVGDEA